MSITSGIVLYAVLWFLCLFVVLPIGQRSQQDAGEIVPGTPAGAPHISPVKRKMLWATVISAVIWGLTAAVIFSGLITRADITNLDRLIR
ncbi:MAG: DUF1467 family protein [Paracoccus sp. (in: a-proteobacteria)]|nr:DUF1467 family protein [Paracoccus sp. (in: a-proteobacteria)]